MTHLSHISAYTVPVLLSVAVYLSIYQIPEKKEIHDFVLENYQEFPEYKATAYLYRHKIYGCPFLNIETSDNHNFFATTFRTTCIDDTGSTHVLEHLTLQGSKRFPISGMFSELLKRSMATLLNAFTSIEWTAYPFSSTNYNDFHNILDVYLDAAFNPLLDEYSFESECHHLEFEIPDNSSTALRHSGVVYNEMNGDTSNPSSRFETLVRSNLYPNSLFRHHYGGNPPDIATLTLQKIKEQHDRYYHPSNSLFYHYGSFGLGEIMKKVSEKIKSYDNSTFRIDEKLIHQKKWEKPRFVIEDGPVEENPDLVRASVSWMVGDLRNMSDVYDLTILGMLLSGSDISPLYKGLIKTGIGTRFLGTGFHDYIRSPYFSIGLEGVSQENARKLNSTILYLLNDIVKDGFQPNLIESVIHQWEMNQRAVTSSQGFHIWEQIVGSWIHDVDPFTLMDIKWQITRIKKVLKLCPQYFEMILKSRLINNPHRLDLIMQGVPNFQENQAKIVKKELKLLKSNMTEEELGNIVKRTSKIKESIEKPKPVELLPSIALKDINATGGKVDFSVQNDVFTFDQPTNGIVYLRIKCEIPLNSEEIKYIPLLKTVLPNIGADDLDDEAFTKIEQLKTGGITTSLVVNPSTQNPDNVKAFLVLESNALSQDTQTMFDLMKKVIMKPHIDNTKRISQLISMAASSITEEHSSNGHLYAQRYSSASLSIGAALNEMWFGVTGSRLYLENAKEQHLNELTQHIKNTYEQLYRKGKFTASLHCESAKSNHLVPQLKGLMKDLNDHENIIQNTTAIKDFMKVIGKSNQTLLKVDSTTYFCACSYKIVDFKDNKSPVFDAFTELMVSEFLWDAIREKLGAYGAKCKFDSYNGILSISSYRDTNPPLILKAIHDSIDAAAEGKLEDAMVERAIVKSISKLDNPIDPRNKGLEYFYDEINYQVKQDRRTKLINATKSEIIECAKIVKGSQRKIAVMGNYDATKIPENFEILDIMKLE